MWLKARNDIWGRSSGKGGIICLAGVAFLLSQCIQSLSHSLLTEIIQYGTERPDNAWLVLPWCTCWCTCLIMSLATQWWCSSMVGWWVYHGKNSAQRSAPWHWRIPPLSKTGLRGCNLLSFGSSFLICTAPISSWNTSCWACLTYCVPAEVTSSGCIVCFLWNVWVIQAAVPNWISMQVQVSGSTKKGMFLVQFPDLAACLSFNFDLCPWPGSRDALQKWWLFPPSLFFSDSWDNESSCQQIS